MIDTLKISKNLEAATLTKPQAEAIAEAIAEVTSADLATKVDIKDLELRLQDRLLDIQNRMHQLIFGTYALIVVGVFINHFWK